MRQLLSILAETRCEQLKTAGQEARIQEVRDMYGFMDRALSSVTLGGPDGQWWDSPYTKLAEAMTSQDFTYALGEFVQRQMIPAYQAKRFNFEPLVKVDTAPNYQTITRYQDRSSLDDLEYQPEKGPVEAGSKSDATKREMKVEVWTKEWDFSSRAIIDDDLGYFADMATQMGQSARRSLERFVSRLYNNATSIARLTGLGALYMMTGRLTSSRIATAEVAFAQRTDARGNPILATLRYLVHPSSLNATVRQIQASELVPELATNAANVVRNIFTPIEDPHIAAPGPSIPWWCFTSYTESNIVPLCIVRRAGLPAPLLVRKASDQETFASFAAGGAPISPLLGDFETGNIVVKVHDEWGAYVDGTEGNLFDFRGAFYSSGTAP